ncbi:thioredoxin reductase [Massilia sp. Root418]|uniref:NAD(P)/FAD-dependent oxidoreductase n=1 Tax=Massilia sp. Root418 TaxID=1736532 RepID=UPI0006F1F60E|nr:NAD(P)/FAD-dependent oxidoreductase [Massilia sp. Root418]KQX01985.1 thioredoxin reductase [Massilia sp. Root418]
MKHYDVIVVGGSFAGLSAAMQLVRARRKVLLIDAGQPRNRWSPAVHGFLALDGMAPAEINAQALRQLQAYPSFELVRGVAHSARKEGDGFAVEWTAGASGALAQAGAATAAAPATAALSASAARLVLATGVKDTLPAIPGLAERWGRTVLHCPYCHGFEVSGGALGVLAAAPQSVHQGLLLPDWGDTTYFTQGLHEPSAEEAAQLQARGARVERVPVVELLGSAPQLDAVRLADGRVLPLHAVFTAPVTSMASPLAGQLGCAFDAGATGPHIQVDAGQQTSVPGVFAAGDAASARHNGTLASAAGVLAGVSAHASMIMGPM